MMDRSSHHEPLAIELVGTTVPTLSIWAAALGVLCLLTLGLTAIPAIICGHLALQNRSGSEAALFGRRIARAGLIAGYGGVVLALLSAFTLL